jgi:hypothetical protein
MIQVLHPGSGSGFFTYPGFRIQGSKRHRIPDSIRHTAKNLIKQTYKAKKYGVKEYFTSVLRIRQFLS